MLLCFQVRWVGQRATAYSWGNDLARIYRQNYVWSSHSRFKSSYFHISSQACLWCWPKRRWSGNAAKRDLWKVRPLQSCPSRTGNNRCKRARREKTSGLTMLHLNGYVKLPSATLTQIQHQLAGKCFHCMCTGLRLIMKSRIHHCPNIYSPRIAKVPCKHFKNTPCAFTLHRQYWPVGEQSSKCVRKNLGSVPS